MKINGRVQLKDLRVISEEEFRKAVGICGKIKNLIELRPEYIKAHRLEDEIAFPSANWAHDTHMEWWYNICNYVLAANFQTINNLRLYTQAFSGYELMAMAFCPYIEIGGVRKKSVEKIPDNFDDIIEGLAPEPDRFVAKYIQITKYLPKAFVAKTPKCLGEIGWDVDGDPVNYDVYSYQERLNFLYESGILNLLSKKMATGGTINILEIGGGYGGLAYQLKRILPKANYFICDLPESLIFSSLYLGLVADVPHTIYDTHDPGILNKNDAGFKFVPNFMFDDVLTAKIKIDLSVNTLSFSEMSEKQVDYYGQKLQILLGDTGLLFEQNQDNRPQKCCYAKQILPNYFTFRQSVIATTVGNQVTSGDVDIWANTNISDIINPALRPFENTLLGSCLKIRFLFTVPYFKSLLKKILGFKLYQVIVERLVAKVKK